MDKVKSYIEKNKDRFLNELFELLRIPSISAQSDHKPDMTRCAEWLAASLMKAGADHAEVLPTEGNPVVFAERDRRSQSQDRIGVRPLRRDAGRSGGRMAHLAVRTGREGRTHLVPGCGRRQRPAFHARQGVRSDVRDRQPALQCEIPARRRGRDRVAQPLQVLRRQQEDAQGRHHIWFPIHR